MGNFDFLKNEYLELSKLGSLAEELIDTDAASCLTKLRLITEFIENILYDECKLIALWDEVKEYNKYLQ